MKKFLLLLFYMLYITTRSWATTIPSGGHVTIDGIEYNVQVYHGWGGSFRLSAHVISYESEYFGVISIPNEILYNSFRVPVEFIDKKSFTNCKGLMSVSIPNSVTSIGEDAFSGCSNLIYVSVNWDTPISIDSKTFTNRKNATLYIPEGTREAYEAATYWNEFKEIKERSELEDQGANIQFADANVKRLCVGNWDMNNDGELGEKEAASVLDLGKVFSRNTEIVSFDELRYFKNMKSIDKDAFTNCTGLTSIVIPNSVESIGENAFYGCSGITSVTIPSSVRKIGYGAFSGCSGLTSLIMPNVYSIETDAFKNCKSLKELVAFRNFDITIPDECIVLVPTTLVNTFKSKNSKANVYEIISSAATQTTISVFSPTEYFKLQSIKYNGKETEGIDGVIKLTDLTPNKEYTFIFNGEAFGKSISGTISVNTKTITFGNIRLTNATNTTLTVHAPTYDAGDAVVTHAGFDGFDENDEVTVKGLLPGASKSVTYRVKTSDGSTFTQSVKYTTKEVIANATATGITASSATIRGAISGVIDVTVKSMGFAENDYKAEKITFTGLDPNQNYTKQFVATFNEGGSASIDVTFTTSALNLATLQPKVISEGNVIVAAESNVDDEETSVGFEWRRTDWTKDFASNTGGAYMYEGTMEGYIRNLNANYLWKFRPYYLSNSGTYYYGDWVGIDPSNTSYFEPTVHTYSRIVVEGNSALVKGYAMRGSDNIVVQGFKYWKSTHHVKGEANASSVPQDAMTVEAKGTVMEASLTGLDYETTYTYVAFMTTSEGETFYGEEQTFTTGENTTGIGGVESTKQTTGCEPAIYDLNGRKLAKMQKGINILRYADGSVKKVMVK